ncbi:uncharacterized protein CIMG_11552 [Coccidioides immitis RS]|uniref:Uncharacterized protein n=5 Tax=Coccidioides TaxID=5500 RepID=A0A0D8JV52_COCIM|nr:uncharacterized protein CIMG_11552 [Coccidioides immitis RS]EFW17461.1 hypothetical protein CPSG_05904 [Coccidioides posadasii str. Silveira]KMM70889.1 hypothetical protein CPAG_07198 [Coccidioides posadasii RMSCC 3488]KMP05591.1 hypothetical protein CIRG_05272 [Coccidioides immitis RMSCC 2394]KMU91163.1 hypothetical protein CIHG_08912 [Coccidioides immitis H538.4]KJF61172.1 hypothetical protein CIMG_11552 [Coccidioides immitis RS]
MAYTRPSGAVRSADSRDATHATRSGSREDKKPLASEGKWSARHPANPLISMCRCYCNIPVKPAPQMTLDQAQIFGTCG